MTPELTTEALVKKVFKEAFGYKPSNIRDLTGKPPSKNNSYLFNAMLTQFEGLCTGKSSIDYLFFIFFDPEDKDWRYDITPVGKTN